MNQEFDLEAALRRALKREEPPGDFTHRVLERTSQRHRRETARVWMAIAAMLVAGVLIASSVRQYEGQRRVEAQKAGHDLAMALKITSAKLHATHRLIRRRSNGA